jgi:NAD(P)-dependent dehydrogenase (short-subunit alcohol dehydrogenase family)
MPQTILIVGASRGIGLGLAEEFLHRGWNVTATARSSEGENALRAMSAGAAGQLVIQTVDSADAESVRALRRRLDGETFDALVVNAGVSGPRDKTPETVDDAAFSGLFLTNSLAPVRLAQIFADRVRPLSGVVAVMTSQLGSVEQASAGGMELYRASKAALNSFARSFAARHTEKGFTTLCLHPGWVKTDMGGPNAAIDVKTSVRGLADVIERAQKDRRSGFFDYSGATLPW